MNCIGKLLLRVKNVAVSYVSTDKHKFCIDLSILHVLTARDCQEHSFLGPVARKVDSAIHRIVIFSRAAERHKKQ